MDIKKTPGAGAPAWKLALKAGLATALVACAGAASAAPMYRVTEVGLTGSEYFFSQPTALNRFRTVVGNSIGTGGCGDSTAFRQPGGSAAAPLLPGFADCSFAQAINDAGQVAGYTNMAPTGGAAMAIRVTGGSAQNLGTLGGRESFALGINQSGQVVGGAQNQAGHYRAFVHDGTVMTDIGAGDGTVAAAINDSGQVVGGSFGGGGGFTYTPGSGVTFLDPSADPRAINNAGQFVGAFDAGSGQRAFMSSGMTLVDLGLLSAGDTFSIARGINDAGQVVGESGGAMPFTFAFLFEAGTMTALESLIVGGGWAIDQAFAINANGDVLGLGFNLDTGYFGGVLLSTVPEPGSLVLLGLALAVGAASRRRPEVAESV